MICTRRTTSLRQLFLFLPLQNVEKENMRKENNRFELQKIFFLILNQIKQRKIVDEFKFNHKK